MRQIRIGGLEPPVHERRIPGGVQTKERNEGVGPAVGVQAHEETAARLHLACQHRLSRDKAAAQSPGPHIQSLQDRFTVLARRKAAAGQDFTEPRGPRSFARRGLVLQTVVVHIRPTQR